MRNQTMSLAIAAMMLLSIGCRDRGTASTVPEDLKEWSDPRVQRYTVLGEVVRLPEAGASEPEIAIRHERIPDFVGDDGEIVGMNAMVMPFPLGPGLKTGGLREGDKIRFHFAMDWGRNRYRLESFEKLPADTELDFGDAAP